MAHYIIHLDGAYNIWSTVVDSPLFESALTLEQLSYVTKRDHGEHGLRALRDRLDRAHATGCSSYIEDLDDVISVNRAGPKESRLSKSEFIAKYLTL
jgi:hypothetical protein